MSATTQNVVNFSELSAEEQSKYVDFLVQNDFVFNNDGKEEAFMATIKINAKKGISKIEQTTAQTSQDKENTTVMNNQLGSKEINDLCGKTEKTMKKMNKIGNNLNQNTMKVQSKTIKTTKPLQNITNSKNNLNLSQHSKQQPNGVAAICQPAVTQGESSQQIEQKKQQILEKLSQKLKEANQLAEIEEASQQEYESGQQQAQEQESSCSEHETFQPSPQQHHKMQINIKKSWKEASKIKRNEKSSNNNAVSSTNPRSNQDNCANHNAKSQTANVRNRSKNAHSKDAKRRACRISQDLMKKNMKYITSLQEKQKESTSKERKRSVSPGIQITPRLSQNLQAPRSSSSTPQANKQPSKQLIQHVPSTFEEVMKRQSHLINSVCQQMQNKTNKRNINGSNSNNIGSISQPEQCVEFNSFGSPNSCQNNVPNNYQGNQSSNHSKWTAFPQADEDKYQRQNIKTKDIPQGQGKRFVHENREGRGNISFHNSRHLEDSEENEQIYRQTGDNRIQTSRQNMRSQEYLQQVEDKEQTRIQLKSNNKKGVILTELRQLVDNNLGLNPQKVPLASILCMIDELYQAKFYENTLIMRMNSQRSHGQGISKSNQKSNDHSNNDQRVNSYSSNQVDSEQYEIQFSEFIYEYFNEKYGFSQKQSCQQFINLIFNVEMFLQEGSSDDCYSPNLILGLRMFADFVQDIRTKEELVFYLFVREMLLKCTLPELRLENNIQETMNIQLSLEQCQQVLEQVYGKKEQKIIDRFMQRLGNCVLQHSNNDMNIGAHFFLDIALEDYIEGKSNKIYESSEYQQQQAREYQGGGQGKQGYNDNHNTFRNQTNQEENEEYNTHEEQQEQENEDEDDYNQLSSFEKLEYTFEQSFGDADHYQSRKQQQQLQSESQQQPFQQLQKQQLFISKKYDCFTPQTELEQRIWSKMIHKIHAFLELVIQDNQDSVNQCQLKFVAVEQIVTKKINKILQCLMIGCREQWLALLCITNPQINHINHLNTLLGQLSSLRTKQPTEITSSQLSNFCKTVLQTKELSKAIGKLLLCIIMPDSQQQISSNNTQ